MGENTLIMTGDAIKALDDTGKVGGYLVRFGSANAPDLTGDYFASDTDFDIDEWPAKTRIYYNHGMDATLKSRKLGIGEMRIDDTGVWVEAQLALRDEYEKAIFALVKSGKMGWSSGTAPHLVERKSEAQVARITSWPLGLDASITPTPAEYRNQVMTIKSLIECDASFEALLPEGDAATSSAGANEVAESEVHNVERGDKPEEIDMTEEVKAVAEAPAVDMGAVMAELKALNTRLDNEPARNAPALALTGALTNDSPMKAMAYWMRTGDRGALKASNATDMNIGTPADGGYAVPTGMFNQIIARRDEMSLASKLGVRRIPGTGLTVNVPLDNEADGEFITKAEAAAYDLDAPALSQAAMTLVKYTKQIKLSEELLADEDANLEAFLVDFIARGMAKTENALLLAEVAANGTLLATTASPTTFAIGEIESIVADNDLSSYLDDSQSVAFVMQSATFWGINKLASANLRYYADSTGGGAPGDMRLLGYPVVYSAKADAISATKKTVFFGNWNYVGMRDGGGLTMLRDPYSNAANGQVNLWYRFRTVFKVLQAEAIGYAAMHA